MKTFAIEDKKLPALILGSSPFCGAGQFGEKSVLYYRKFFQQPENITRLIVKMCNTGYPTAHLLAYTPIASAAEEAYKQLGYRFPVMVTFMPEDPQPQWEWIDKLDTAVAFMHAFETDQLNLKVLKDFARQCRKRGIVPGVSTHNGGRTIPVLDESGIDVSIYLCPFNKTGLHVHPSLDGTLEAITNTPKTVVGMKILSCGNLCPAEAFEYSLPYVDAITVGMVTEREIEENCKEFERFKDLLGIKRKKVKPLQGNG